MAKWVTPYLWFLRLAKAFTFFLLSSAHLLCFCDVGTLSATPAEQGGRGVWRKEGREGSYPWMFTDVLENKATQGLHFTVSSSLRSTEYGGIRTQLSNLSHRDPIPLSATQPLTRPHTPLLAVDHPLVKESPYAAHIPRLLFSSHQEARTGGCHYVNPSYPMFGGFFPAWNPSLVQNQCFISRPRKKFERTKKKKRGQTAVPFCSLGTLRTPYSLRQRGYTTPSSVQQLYITQSNTTDY